MLPPRDPSWGKESLVQADSRASWFRCSLALHQQENRSRLVGVFVPDGKQSTDNTPSSEKRECTCCATWKARQAQWARRRLGSLQRCYHIVGWWKDHWPG